MGVNPLGFNLVPARLAASMDPEPRKHNGTIRRLSPEYVVNALPPGRVMHARNVNAAFPERKGPKTVPLPMNALFPNEKLAMRPGMPHIPLIPDAAVSQEIQVSVC